ncbi:MAG: CHASE2 domain-containing protein, partial [Hydrogenovibrio sp.]
MRKRLLKQAKHVRIWIALITITAVIILAYAPKALQKTDWLLGDVLTQWLSSPQTVNDIVLIDIDDNSLQTLGDWPWPRALLAQLLQTLFTDHHPKGVALDMVLPEPKEAKGDAELAALLQQYPICLAVAFDLEQNPQTREIGTLPKRHDAFDSIPESQAEPLLPATGYIANHRQLTEAAQCIGHITPLVEADGVIRQIPRAIEWNGQAWPNLALALHRLTQGQSAVKKQVASHSTHKSIERIPYKIPYRDWPSIPAQTVLMGEVPPGFLDGKTLFIGSSALGLSDRVTTPIHPWLPGVVIHAEMLNHLLHPEPIYITHFQALALAYGLIAVLLVAWWLTRWHPIYALLGALVLAVAWLGLAAWGWQQQLDFSPSLPWVAILLIVTLQVPYEWMVIQRQNQKITKLFQGYVSPAIVQKLLASDLNPLEPQISEVTVMFADIEGFTKMGRHLTTDELSTISRQVLTLITEEIYRADGTLDKYIGDAAMAFWNAPIPQKNHAQKALDCALEIQRKLQTYNEKNPQSPIQVRIGIHTGDAMIGDLGTRFRNTYTAIGDTVNIAHRLHDLTKEYDTMVLISSATESRLTRRLDEPNF